MVKDWSANARDIRDLGSITGSGRSPGGGHGNPLQYSCLENPMEKDSETEAKTAAGMGQEKRQDRPRVKES